MNYFYNVRITLVIPIHNEEIHLRSMLDSILSQSVMPQSVILVNDHSTDNSQKIIEEYCTKHSFIESVYNYSSTTHEPGSKVINAFYKGFDILKGEFDLIGKFDADIVLPNHYFENIVSIFESSANIGIAGGNLYIKQNGKWVFENISSKTKVRGPIKLYRKECFQAIGGLKASIGWDTVDVLLAEYHGWKSITDKSLHVKHLKPTGQKYLKRDAKKQGEAFKKMRYGFLITLIASGKLAVKKKSLSYFFNCMKGFFSSTNNYIVSPEEGKFIRNLRWKAIRSKLL